VDVCGRAYLIVFNLIAQGALLSHVLSFSTLQLFQIAENNNLSGLLASKQ
jgi:hypothetical protein